MLEKNQKTFQIIIGTNDMKADIDIMAAELEQIYNSAGKGKAHISELEERRH